MPAYQTTPFKQSPALMYPGIPVYLWGSFNDKTGPTLGTVRATSGNGVNASVKFLISSGNIPVAGSLVTIVGTANASGNYNVTNATILTVSAAASPDAGIYTITFSNTTASVAASDAGQLIIPQPEVGETLTNSSSVPAAMPYGNSTYNQNQGLTAVVSFPSAPTSVTVVLQQAIQDIDSEYATVATIVNATNTTQQITVDPTLGRFFRFKNSGTSGGTLPTIVAKLLM